VVRKPFPDHHRYAADEITALMACARREGLAIVTTEKDLARLRGDPAAAELVERLVALPVTLKFREEPAVKAKLCDICPPPPAVTSPHPTPSAGQ
jgi:tetraacyldisaccharide 4'-kinase